MAMPRLVQCILKTPFFADNSFSCRTNICGFRGFTAEKRGKLQEGCRAQELKTLVYIHKIRLALGDEW